MEDTRRRAVAACDRCRRRKRRCDGREPSCSGCQKVGAECNYTSHDQRRSTQNSGELVERLSGLESMLEAQAASIEDLRSAQLRRQQPATAAAVPSLPSQPHQQAQNQYQHVSPIQFAGPATSPFGLADSNSQWQQSAPVNHETPSLSFDIEAPPMVIPRGHSTTTESLLGCEQVKAVLGQFPSGMFLIKEVKRDWPFRFSFLSATFSTEKLPSVSRSDTEHLVEAYFSLAHGELPILDHGVFYETYNAILEAGLEYDAGSALLLVVLAIGSVVTAQFDPSNDTSEEPEPGLQYISNALKILVPDAFHSFGSTVAIPQALLLAAKYFGYLLRPLQSWKLVSMASTSIQHLCSVAFGPKDNLQHIATISLTAWAVFDTESDLIAEHQLPHSGIEHVMENMPFPSFDDHSDATLLFLAELSVRKLLNRVHYTLYDNAAPTFLVPLTSTPGDNQVFRRFSVSQVLTVSKELDRQLETWFQMLPSTIRPDLHDPSSWGVYQLCLMQRYYSAKDIIFRPFVMYACSLPTGQHLPSLLAEQCEVCLKSCRHYIQSSSQRLEQVCSNREIIIHSLLASTIVLTIAALCPKLNHLVPDISEMQNEAIKTVGPWARAGSLVEDIAEILKLLRTKTTLLRP